MIEIPVRVRDALKSGAYRNNYKVVVLDQNGNEDFTIDNDNLVEESVTVDERMCSTDTLKFGLCEGTNIEFQYFGYPNITGRKVKLYIDVTYRDESHTLKEYEIPLGWFDIKECSRQAETGIIKASGYNKLLSDYLDQDLTEAVKEIVATGENGVTGSASVQHIMDVLLKGYSIETAEESTGKVSIPSALWSRGYFGNSGYRVVGTSNFIHVIISDFYLDINNATTADYFRFEIFVDKLREKFKTWCPYLNSIVAIQDETHVLEEFINNGFSSGFEGVDAQYCCGYYEVDSIALGGSSSTGYYHLPIFKKIFAKTDYIKTQYATNLNVSGDYPHPIRIYIPVMWVQNTSADSYTPTAAQVTTCNARATEIINAINEYIVVYKKKLSEMEKYKVTSANVSSITNGLTLRALQSATFELSAQYGKLDRVTDLFSGVNLNGGRLYPSETLYPSNDLYPRSNSEHIIRANYSQLWADEGNVRKFRNLIVTYKDSTTNQDATITAIVNADGTDDYIMSDNWLLKNLAWTQAQVNTYVNGMVEAMRGVTWFPFQMWLAGLPYIEAGDEIEITSGGLVYPSYVLTRTLKGIQDLQDTYTNGTLNIF